VIEFWQVDVFAEGPFRGNPLAVFPDPGELDVRQMQAIASEMNLSETTFVQSSDHTGYDVRIFTPHEELPFAGHPTLGTAWVLRALGRVEGDRVVQRSAAGETPVDFESDLVWLQRTGSSGVDLSNSDIHSNEKIADALGLEPRDIGLEAREMGRSGRLEPAFANSGVEQLFVPLRDIGTLARIRPRADRLSELTDAGAYCFSAEGAGRLRARGFFAPVGIEEDPATGSACAGLGLYLEPRVGPVDVEVHQGIEMGRPSLLFLKASEGVVRVGGRCHPVLKGRLEALP
jgi:trans-2,3-dihydro-3-hydroxyanthranilate isomerase